MARGYCSDCGQLVPIRAGARHDEAYLLGTKSRRWYPEPHLNGAGEPCESKREAGDFEFAAPSGAAARGVPQS